MFRHLFTLSKHRPLTIIKSWCVFVLRCTCLCARNLQNVKEVSFQNNNEEVKTTEYVNQEKHLVNVWYLGLCRMVASQLTCDKISFHRDWIESPLASVYSLTHPIFPPSRLASLSPSSFTALNITRFFFFTMTSSLPFLFAAHKPVQPLRTKRINWHTDTKRRKGGI